MNGIMNENQLTIVRKYEINKTLFHKIDAITDNWYRDCHNKYYHTFEYEFEYDIKVTNNRNNEIANLTIVDKSMGLFEITKIITVARQISFIFNQMNKLTIKIYSNLQSINICYYLKHCIPICHRLFFRRISQKKEHVKTHCNNVNNPCLLGYRKWYLYNIPQC